VVVYFEVTDSGRGIDAVDHERVFEAFWQKDSSRTRTTGGTGLGLAVARQLAQLLGGDVVVTRSALGEGSTFTVSLPASYRAPAAATT
jgi:two-component system sensor histidine kinase BaeS